MNAITEAHTHSPMRKQISTFNSYNLFTDIILIQSMVYVMLIVHIFRFPPQDERAIICVSKVEMLIEVSGLSS